MIDDSKPLLSTITPDATKHDKHGVQHVHHRPIQFEVKHPLYKSFLLVDTADRLAHAEGWDLLEVYMADTVFQYEEQVFVEIANAPVDNVSYSSDKRGYWRTVHRTMPARRPVFLFGMREDAVVIGLQKALISANDRVEDAWREGRETREDLEKAKKTLEQSAKDLAEAVERADRLSSLADTWKKSNYEVEARCRKMETDLGKLRTQIGEKQFRELLGDEK